MHKLSLILAACFALTAPSIAAAKQCDRPQGAGPSLYVWDADNLAKSRTRVRRSDTRVMPAYEKLIAEADKVLPKGPFSVTNKTKTPPSGSKHDYYSIGPYWWPNPKKKSGLPYIRKDGKTNPERYDDSFDSSRMSTFASAVETLALAAYFSADKRYADRAAVLLRTWFLDPATRMNPNLNFGQAIPGKTEGRGIGIIDTYRFVKLVDSIGVLSEMGALSPREREGLQSWFSDYALWMLMSENGKQERAALNNHGIYFDAQLMAFSAFSGDMAAVKVIANGVKKSRIPGQINKKGQLPLELKRTRPFHYTAFTVNAFFDAADVAECVGEDLWYYETPKQQSLKSALAYQAQYAGALTKWRFKEIRTIKPEGLHTNLLRGNQVYDDPNISRAAKVYAQDYKTRRTVLLYPQD